MGTADAILREFDEQRDRYGSFLTVLTGLLEQTLAARGVRAHAVTGRLKSRESLADKLAKPDAGYETLADLTDIAATRIITNFASDVDVACKAVEDGFTIDRDNSMDKRALLDPDRFGYLSVHYIVSLTDRHLEYGARGAFRGLRAEVQVRSILQHAWAENEHDLGYKSRTGVPNIAKRRFAHVAGLLEVADQILDELRRDLSTYADDAAGFVANRVAVPLDQITLRSYLARETRPQALRRRMEEATGGRFVELGSFVDESVPMLHELGITNIDRLGIALEEGEEDIVAMHRLRMQGFGSISEGTELLFLAYLLVGEQDSQQALEEFFDRHNITTPDRREGLAVAVLAQVRTIRASSSREGET